MIHTPYMCVCVCVWCVCVCGVGVCVCGVCVCVLCFSFFPTVGWKISCYLLSCLVLKCAIPIVCLNYMVR